MNAPSMHTLGLQLQHKIERIKELEQEVARLKIGGQPASKVRDMVLPTLLQIRELNFNEPGKAPTLLLDKLITALGDNIPGEVEYKPAPPKHEAAHAKPYPPLNHGPRDNEAAAAKYRTAPR